MFCILNHWFKESSAKAGTPHSVHRSLLVFRGKRQQAAPAVRGSSLRLPSADGDTGAAGTLGLGGQRRRAAAFPEKGLVRNGRCCPRPPEGKHAPVLRAAARAACSKSDKMAQNAFRQTSLSEVPVQGDAVRRLLKNEKRERPQPPPVTAARAAGGYTRRGTATIPPPPPPFPAPGPLPTVPGAAGQAPLGPCPGPRPRPRPRPAPHSPAAVSRAPSRRSLPTSLAPNQHRPATARRQGQTALGARTRGAGRGLRAGRHPASACGGTGSCRPCPPSALAVRARRARLRRLAWTRPGSAAAPQLRGRVSHPSP